MYINTDLYEQVHDDIKRSVPNLELDAVLDQIKADLKQLGRPHYMPKLKKEAKSSLDTE